MRTEELKEEIKNIQELRRIECGNIRHRLEDIIIIGLCIIICWWKDFADMKAFDQNRQEYPAKFLELPNGMPDSDTFRRVFEKLNLSELSSSLINWTSIERNNWETVAIDGKTICGSGNHKHKAYHVVSAFVVENQLTLGEICVEEKTNETIVVPEWLDLIDVKDNIVTADAMSGQKKIVEKIIDKKAGYTIGLKKNQPWIKDMEESKKENIVLTLLQFLLKSKCCCHGFCTASTWLFCSMCCITKDNIPESRHYTLLLLGGVKIQAHETELGFLTVTMSIEISYF